MPKDPQQSLKDWSAQKWMTSGTYSNKKKDLLKEVKSKGTKRYLPEAAWSVLTTKEKSATNKAKKEGNKENKQFVKQPKNIAKKTSKFR